MSGAVTPVLTLEIDLGKVPQLAEAGGLLLLAEVHPELQHHGAVVGLCFLECIDAVEFVGEFDLVDSAMHMIKQRP